MTKRKSKTSKREKSAHEKLGITFAELGALYGTRALLAAGVVTGTDECMIDNDSDTDLQDYEIENGVHRFNMNVAAKGQACASISCIGGTMALIMGKTVREAQYYVGSYYKIQNKYKTDPAVHSRPLHTLFFPSIDDDNWERIPPGAAIEAIDNFLGGVTKFPWESVSID